MIKGAGSVGSETPPAKQVDKQTRKANVRLAIILGLIALGFYLMLMFLNPP